MFVYTCYDGPAVATEREEGVRVRGCKELAGRAADGMAWLIGRAWGYALVFALLFLFAWVPVFVTIADLDVSFFWDIDGLSQQYVWFVYTGQWLREVWGALIGGQGLQFPMWTMDSGFGVDTVQSLVCTAVNPFYAVSAFVSEEHAEFVFEAMLVVQTYCAGLAFSLWSLGRGTRRSSTLVGALAYVFAGNMTAIFLQPGFLFPALVFPLALRGADRIFARRSPLLYIAVMAWVFAFSFYDAYMICVMLVLYCIVVFFADAGKSLRGKDRWAALAGWVGRFVGYTLTSVLLGSALFLPQAMAVVSQDRLDVERAQQVLYAPTYYIKFLVGFTYFSFAGGDAYTGWNALAVPALLFLIARRRQHPALFWSFLVLTVMMLLPFFGSLMNAFQYPTARWSWAYSAMVSFAIALLLPELMRMRGAVRGGVAAVTLLYVVATFVFPVATLGRAEAVLLACMLVACLLGQRVGYRLTVASLALLVAVAGSVSFSGFLVHIGSHSPAGQSWALHAEQGTAGLIEQAKERGDYDESYRYDRTNSLLCVQNSNLITGYMGANFYNSMYNDRVDALLRSLGDPATRGANHRFDSLDGGAYIDALLGVRYLHVADEDAAGMPSTFRAGRAVAQRDGETLYEASDVLPVAFVQTGYITRERYRELSCVERREALLQAVVVDRDAAVDGLVNKDDGLDLSVQTIPYEVQADGCVLEDGTVVVEEPGATLRLWFSPVGDSETYLCLNGMDYRDFQASDYAAPGEWDAMDPLGRFSLVLRETKQAVSTRASRVTTAHVKVSSDLGCETIAYPNAEDPMYGGSRDWACNLGYSANGTDSVVLTFENRGIYRFDSIEVQALPMEPLERYVEELKGLSSADVLFGCNRISCSVDTETDGMLFLSVACADGWSAEVDGEPADIVRADLGFMGVLVGEGHHEVVLSYETPYARLGAALSVLGLMTGAAVGIWHHRRGRFGKKPALNE